MKYFEKAEYQLLYDHDEELLETTRPSGTAVQSSLRYVLSVLIAIASFTAGRLSCSRSQTLKDAWGLWSDFSPITEAIVLNGTTQELNPSFIQQQNLFYDTPSPALDEAWANITKYPYVWLTEDHLRRKGKDPTVSVKVPKDWGLDEDAYLAQTDMGHKIHCLDKLRKEAHFDYYYGSIFQDGKPSQLHQSHTTHCLEVLLQSLVCEASTEIIPFTWKDHSDRLFRDPVRRKCGNFDGVVQWARDHELHNPWEIEKPEGQATGGPANEELVSILTQIDDGTKSMREH